MDVLRGALMGRRRGENDPTGSESDGPGCLQMLLTRMWGAGVAITVMVLAALNLIFCLQWSIYMMSFGFVMLLLEASFVAGLFDCSEEFGQLLGRVKPWQKAILYCLSSIPPIFGCFGLSTLIACGAWFAAGIAYFYIFMKASRARPHTVSYSKANDEAEANLVDEAADSKDGDATTEQSAWWPFSSSAKTHTPAEANPKPSQAPAKDTPVPAMTGSMPASVPPAFPEPALPESVTGPRTVAYTGAAVTPAPAPSAPAPALPMPQQAGAGPRTVAYSGPLIKPVGAARLS